MPIGEMSRKNFSSGTSTSGSGGSGGSAGHYESSGYESVIRDSECSSLGSSSQDSDREAVPLELAISTGKQSAAIGMILTKRHLFFWKKLILGFNHSI